MAINAKTVGRNSFHFLLCVFVTLWRSFVATKTRRLEVGKISKVEDVERPIGWLQLRFVMLQWANVRIRRVVVMLLLADVRIQRVVVMLHLADVNIHRIGVMLQQADVMLPLANVRLQRSVVMLPLANVRLQRSVVMPQLENVRLPLVNVKLQLAIVMLHFPIVSRETGGDCLKMGFVNL